MWEFFKEGGWPMWSILFLGMFLLGASLRFAIRPERARIGFLVCMSLATLAATLHGMVMDLGTVFFVVADPARVPDAEVTRTLLQGFHESTRPGTFGGGLLTIAFILMAVGYSRLARKESPAA
jgi:hypothetical protein